MAISHHGRYVIFQMAEVAVRSLLDWLRQSQRPHEVCEIVGHCVELKPHGVGGERAA
jgi:hypothetical protein